MSATNGSIMRQTWRDPSFLKLVHTPPASQGGAPPLNGVAANPEPAAVTALPGSGRLADPSSMGDGKEAQSSVSSVFGGERVSAGGVSESRGELLQEQADLEEKLKKPEDYPEREADEARLKEISEELGNDPGIETYSGGANAPPPPGEPAPPPRGSGSGAGGGEPTMVDEVYQLGRKDGEAGRAARPGLIKKKYADELHLNGLLTAYKEGYKDGKVARLQERTKDVTTLEAGYIRSHRELMTMYYDRGFWDGKAGKTAGRAEIQKDPEASLAVYDVGYRDGQADAKATKAAYQIGYADALKSERTHRESIERESPDELLAAYDQGYSDGHAKVLAQVQNAKLDPNQSMNPNRGPSMSPLTKDEQEADRKATEEWEFLKEWLSDGTEQHPPHGEHGPHEPGDPGYTEDNHVQRPTYDVPRPAPPNVIPD